MESKIIYGIIAVFFAVIIIIFIGFATNLIPNEKINLEGSSSSGAVPTIELKSNNNSENKDSVSINLTASVEDNSGIKKITLPDGSIVEDSDKASYKITENGTYKFVVEANNGQKAEKTIKVSNIKGDEDKQPYIPKGFSYVEGEIDDGYTIEDSYGNQYVWVPVDSGKMTRNTAGNNNYEETNSSATELVNRVAQNYGFYVAKYEASEYEVDGKTVVASMPDSVPMTDITYLKAADMAAKSADGFGYEDCCTAIMNSYAWDTMLKWIDKNNEGYSSSTEYGNYSGEIANTGETASDIKNNICDLSGNVREWTTEVYKKKENSESKNEESKNDANTAKSKVTSTYRVVRGGSANNMELSANSHTGYNEKNSDDYWGFRMILYKK